MINKYTWKIGLILFFTTKCWAGEIDKVAYEALLTRYISVLNAISEPNAAQKNEIERELLLSLMINYYYLKDQNNELSDKFKEISKSIGKNVAAFNFNRELGSYLNMIKSMDDDSAVFRLTLDGFDEKTAKIMLDKTKNNDFDELKKWVALK